MSEQYIAEHCAPTLAGIKTGNLFSVQNGEGKSLKHEIRELNRRLSEKGLRVIPVKQTGTHTLVYIYRPDRLEKDLSSAEAVRILEKKGYDVKNASLCLKQLISRLSKDDAFPHEIGLFLGYPPSDVEGFMKNPNQGVKCSGVWKAYSNEEEAKRTFIKYRKCTRDYCSRLAAGSPLMQMVV
ncbi:MAG: DUF3793 family protein [Lachnospiraceae bacterium]|nr:DUF3793 family protein [Lachnospiraceae bacterium]